jgi:hypothetical protein
MPLSGLLSEEKRKEIATRFVRETWVLTEILKEIGAICVPNRQELRDYDLGEARIVLIQLKEALFFRSLKPQPDMGDSTAGHPANLLPISEFVNVNSAAPIEQRAIRSRRIPKEVAEVLIREHLRRKPNAKVAEIHQATRVSAGAISQSIAWKSRHPGKKAGATAVCKGRKEASLSAKMLDCIQCHADPSEMAAQRENAWRYVLESAQTDAERAALHGLSAQERDPMIESVLEHFQEHSRETY